MPLPARKDWNIGIVGFGEFAQRAHVPDYQKAGWNVTAVAVRSASAQQAARERFGIERVYSDYLDLINDDSVEVIDVLTQPSLREPVVKAAAVAGKHVIVEKPFGCSITECRRMVEAADESRIRLAVHQNFRWMKGSFVARHAVRAGLVGVPFFMSIQKFGGQDVSHKNSVYAGFDDYLTLHWNTHFVDLFRFWSGSDAKVVSTRTTRMPGQNFHADGLLLSSHDFGGGLNGQIVHSELLRSALVDNSCRIDGDEGSLVFDLEGKRLLLDSRKLGSQVHSIDTSGMQWMDALCGSMGDFLLAIEEDREPSVSGRDNLITMKTVFAEIDRAHSGGAWQQVED